MPLFSTEIDGFLVDLFRVQKLVAFLGDQKFIARFHRHAPRLGAAAEGLAHDVGNIDHAGRDSRHPRNVKGSAARIGNLDFNFLVVERIAAQFLAEIFLGYFRGIGADQRFQHARLGIEMGLRLHILAPRHLHHADAGLDEIADDLVHIAAHIANLGELRGLDFQERRIGELGQPPGNFGLADTRGPDHQDILREHFLAHHAGELLAPPAVAQGHGHRPLGIILARRYSGPVRKQFHGAKSQSWIYLIRIGFMLHDKDALGAPRQIGHRPETCFRVSAHGARVFRIRINDDRGVAFGL